MPLVILNALITKPALSEGPGTNGHAPDKVDVERMKELRRNGLRARKRRRR